MPQAIPIIIGAIGAAAPAAYALAFAIAQITSARAIFVYEKKDRPPEKSEASREALRTEKRKRRPKAALS